VTAEPARIPNARPRNHASTAATFDLPRAPNPPVCPASLTPRADATNRRRLAPSRGIWDGTSRPSRFASSTRTRVASGFGARLRYQKDQGAAATLSRPRGPSGSRRGPREEALEAAQGSAAEHWREPTPGRRRHHSGSTRAAPVVLARTLPTLDTRRCRRGRTSPV
jgi:hypothetical protein